MSVRILSREFRVRDNVQDVELGSDHDEYDEFGEHARGGQGRLEQRDPSGPRNVLKSRMMRGREEKEFPLGEPEK